MSDRVLVCLQDGRWLALTAESFEGALSEGAKFNAAPASSCERLNEPVLVDAAEMARLTSTAASWWHAAARELDCPSLFVGKDRRFNVAACLAWLERVQERDATGRARRSAVAPRCDA